MLNLGACYLSEQDETDDSTDIKAMTGVLHTLTSLIDGEIDETEPDEPDDTPMTGMYSADGDGTDRDGDPEPSRGHHSPSKRPGAFRGHHSLRQPRPVLARGHTCTSEGDEQVAEEKKFSRDELRSHIAEVKERISELATEYEGREFSEEARLEFEALKDERAKSEGLQGARGARRVRRHARAERREHGAGAEVRVPGRQPEARPGRPDRPRRYRTRWPATSTSSTTRTATVRST
jgi:hypothetical protein